MGSQDSDEGSHPWSKPHELNQSNDSYALVPFQTPSHISEDLPFDPISSSMEQALLPIEVYDSGNNSSQGYIHPQISHQLNPSHDSSSLVPFQTPGQTSEDLPFVPISSSAFFPTEGTSENLSFPNSFSMGQPILSTNVYDHSSQGNILHNPETFHPQENLANLVEEFGPNNSPQRTPIEGNPKRLRGDNPLEMEGASRTERPPLFPPVLAREGSPVPEEPERTVALLAPGLSCTRPPTRPSTRKPTKKGPQSHLKQTSPETRKLLASSSRVKKWGNFSDFLLGASRFANSSSPSRWGNLGTKMTTPPTNQSNPETSSKGKGILDSQDDQIGLLPRRRNSCQERTNHEAPERDAGEQRINFMTEENASIRQLLEELEEAERLALALQMSLEPFEPASQVPNHGPNAPYHADHFQTQSPITSLPLVPFEPSSQVPNHETNAPHLADHSQNQKPITSVHESSYILMSHGTYNELSSSNQNPNQNPDSSLREGDNNMFPGNSSIDHDGTNTNLGTSETFNWDLPTDIYLLLKSVNAEEYIKELDEQGSSGQKTATEEDEVPNPEPQEENSQFVDWVVQTFNQEDDPKKFTF